MARYTNNAAGLNVSDEATLQELVIWSEIKQARSIVISVTIALAFHLQNLASIHRLAALTIPAVIKKFTHTYTHTHE